MNQAPLVDHLRELRDRLIRSLWGILIGGIVAYSMLEPIMDIIRKPIQPFLPVGGLVFTAPIDKFMMGLKVSFFSGILFSAPWWLYQLWKFISPGLHPHERKYGLVFISAGTLLFCVGLSFAYYLVLPAAFDFLMAFGGETDKPMITIVDYMSFFVSMMVVFGFAFELPLVIVILGMLGVVNQQFLREKRRYLIVGMSVVAAIVTPPDVMSMLMMLVPLVILLEISIWLVGFFEKKSGLELNEDRT